MAVGGGREGGCDETARQRRRRRSPGEKRGDDEETGGVEVKLNPGRRATEGEREVRGRRLLQQMCDYARINIPIFPTLPGLILSSPIPKRPLLLLLLLL